jgi:Uma2 family endonuclease
MAVAALLGITGVSEETNGGDFNHSFLKIAIAAALTGQGLRAYISPHLEVKAGRFRISDLLVLAPGQKRARRYLKTAPYIVIEILSSEDRVGELREKLDDYLAMDIPNIWVVDPDAHTLTVHHSREAHTFTDRVTASDGAVSIDLLDIFRRLSDDEAQ